MTEQDKELQELRRELTQAQSANAWLKHIVQKLERENDELRQRIEKLREENTNGEN